MISLSNVIKIFQYKPVEDAKLVKSVPPKVAAAPQQAADGYANAAVSDEETEQLHQMKEQILQDAASYAEDQVRAAMEEAAVMKEQAALEIEQWWTEKRALDSEAADQAREAGFEQGYREGLVQAQAELQEKYEQMLQEAAQIVEQAHEMKHQVIQEAEPFLIELSSAIAQKIIQRQLTIEPEWTIQLVASVLERRREKGVITLCVSPGHYAYIQAAREELLLHIDSQAELAIIPDPSVHDHGCVVRSTFGSVDARIDTQLSEIKNALVQLAVRNEG